MKGLILIAVLLSNYVFGQDLKFTTKYFDAVDKWTVFDKKENDSTYAFGFIYIDEQAGFTFDYGSKIKITENGLVKLPKEFESSLKSRLSPNTQKVHILTEKELTELELPTIPEWLSYYKKNENEVSYLVKIGYHYNHVGASKNAIKPLLEAYSKEPHYKGLEFELAFAYNATKNYEKATEVLTKAIENDPNNFWFYRELGYSYKNLEDLEKAEGAYKKGIELSNDKFQKAEMAVNMAQSYFQSNNKSKFDEWAKITKKYAEKGSDYYN
jgi:tetratricopeptide (TPR) repeat protein